jgi:hypothetical protein
MMFNKGWDSDYEDRVRCYNPTLSSMTESSRRDGGALNVLAKDLGHDGFCDLCLKAETESGETTE